MTLVLCSYVCTNSMETAHLASEQLETGSVAVNTGAVAIAEAPFGGIKQSGYGTGRWINGYQRLSER